MCWNSLLKGVISHLMSFIQRSLKNSLKWRRLQRGAKCNRLCWICFFSTPRERYPALSKWIGCMSHRFWWFCVNWPSRFVIAFGCTSIEPPLQLWTAGDSISIIDVDRNGRNANIPTLTSSISLEFAYEMKLFCGNLHRIPEVSR
jgi:hypothetical protein